MGFPSVTITSSSSSSTSGTVGGSAGGIILPEVNFPSTTGSASTETLNDVATNASDTQMTVAAQNAPLRVMYGLVRVGAQIANVVPWGSFWVVQAIWGEGPIQSIEAIHFGDEAVPAGVVQTHYLGDATAPVADPTLVSAFTANSFTYTDTLPGIAYSVFKIPSDAGTSFSQIEATLKGLKVRDPRGNLITYSEQFDHANWGSSRLNAESANATTAADGTLTAEKLNEDTQTGAHHIYQGFFVSDNETVTISVELKAAERSKAHLNLFCRSNTYKNVTIDLTTGVLSAITSGYTASVSDLGNGWYRVWLTGSVEAGTYTPRLHVFCNNGSTSSYTGTTGYGVYVAKAQANRGEPMGYVASTAFRVVPTTDGNNQIYSEQFENAAWTKITTQITTNATTAPDGATTADKLEESATTNTSHYVCQNGTLKAAELVTFSIYAKAAERTQLRLQLINASNSSNYCYAVFDLTNGDIDAGPLNVGTATQGAARITSCGDGWYRCEISGIADPAAGVVQPRTYLVLSNSAAYAGTVGYGCYIWGAQLNAGSTADDYVYTSSTVVTPANVWSDNPSLCLADFKESTLYGDGGTVENAGLSLCASANDELVQGGKRRTFGLVIDSVQNTKQWVEALRTYAGCWIVPEGNISVMVPDRPRATDFTLTHASGQILKISSLKKRGVLQSPNAIEIRYTSTAQVPWRDESVWVYGAGVLNGTVPRRDAQVALPGIQSAAMATREGIERLNRSQLADLSCTVEVFDEGAKYRVGDVTEVTHPIGLTMKPMRVMGVSGTYGRYTLSLSEYEPAVYSNTSQSDPTYPDTLLPNPLTTALSAPGTPTITEEIYQSSDGTVGSRLRISWAAPVDLWPLQYQVKIEVSGVVLAEGVTYDPAWVFGPLEDNKNYTVKVYAQRVGFALLSSAATNSLTALGKLLPPSNVTGATHAFTPVGLELKWDPVIDIDLAGYRIYKSGVLVATATLTRINMGYVIAGSHAYTVTAYDYSGNESAVPSAINVTIPTLPAPVGLNGSTATGEVALTWSAPASTWPIAYYEVGYGTTPVHQSGSTHYEGQVGYLGTRTWYVKTVNLAGEVSVSATKVLVVNVPSGPVITPAIIGNKASLKWDTVASSLPLQYYEIRRDSTGGPLIATTSTTDYRVPIDWTGSRTFYVIARDSDNNLSPEGVAGFNITAPVAPVVSHSFVAGTLKLTWTTPSSSLPIQDYEIGYDAISLGRVMGTTFELPVTWNGARQFWVKARNLNLTVGASGTTDTSVSAPQTCTGFRTEVVDNNVLLYWTGVQGTLPIVTFELRKGDTWATAALIGEKSGGFTTIFETVAGTYTYWIAGKDSAGNVGTPTSRQATVAQPPDYVLNRVWDRTTFWYRWDFEGTTESWTAAQATLTASGSGVVLTATSADPMLRLSGLNFFGGNFSRLQARVTRLAAGTWDGKCFYTTAGHGESGSYLKTIADPGLAVGSSTLLEWDMSSLSLGGTDWVSNFITGLRLDLDQTSGSSFHIEYIQVLPSIASNSVPDTDGSLVMGANSTETFQAHFTNLRVSALAVNAGGTGYAVNDIIELNTGTAVAKARGKVLTLSGSAVATLSVDHCGNYTVAPSAAGATTAITGTGTGLTVTATAAAWSTPQDQINAGYGVYIHPSLMPSYYEEQFDYGVTLITQKVSVLYSGAAVSGSPTLSCTISVSTNGSSWTDYVGVTEVFASNFRYVKVRVNCTSGQYDMTSFKVMLDAKLKNDAGNCNVYSNVSGTYVQAGTTTITVTATAHGRLVDDLVYLDFTSGTGTDGIYKVVTKPDANTFTVTAAGVATTSGSVTLDAGGTPVKFTIPYIDVGSITVSPASTSPLFAIYDFVDAPLPTDFRILLYTQAGARTSGRVSWSVKGY